MKKPSRVGRWISNILTFACIAVVSVSIYYLIVRFGYLNSLQSGIVALTTFFGLCVLQRQVDLARDIKALKNLDWAELMGEQSDDVLAARLDELSNKIDAVSSSVGPADIGIDDNHQAIHQTLDEKLHYLESRIEALESLEASEPASESASFVETVPPITTPQSSAQAKQSGAKAKLNTDIVTVSDSGMPSASMSPFLAKSDFVDKREKKSQTRKVSLKDGIGVQNLNMHLQPIVELPDRKPLYFDAFMRLKDDTGDFLEQKEFLNLIEEGGLASMIDQKVVHSSIRMLGKLEALKKRSGVFCNLSLMTLESPKAMSEIEKILRSNKKLTDTLFLEIRQRDLSMLRSSQLKGLSDLAKLGFKFSLSHVLDLKLDIPKLSKLGFKFVKVPASILLHASFDEDTDGVDPSALSGALEENGITLVGTGIEKEKDAIGMIDHDVSFGQGLLFAPPRPVKAELVEAVSTKKKRSEKVAT